MESGTRGRPDHAAEVDQKTDVWTGEAGFAPPTRITCSMRRRGNRLHAKWPRADIVEDFWESPQPHCEERYTQKDSAEERSLSYQR